jgi:hypothetical protein
MGLDLLQWLWGSSRFNATYGASVLAFTYGAWLWKNDIENSH